MRSSSIGFAGALGLAGALALSAPALAGPDYQAIGAASWYGEPFHGRKTASGERFDMNMVTAAHRTLPFGSIVEVTNLDNDKSVKVRINDRGPFKASRLIDVSREAADQLGFRHKGMAKVRLRVIDEDEEDAEETAPATSESVEETLRPTLPVEVVAREVAEAVAPAARPPSGVIYAIQVGAFSRKGNADRAAAAVAETGPVTLKPLELRGLTLHRVLVGAWPDEKSARAALDRVEGAGFPDAQVVRLN